MSNRVGGNADKFDVEIFSNESKNQIFEKIEVFSRNLEEFQRCTELFGKMLDFFQVFWKREALVAENELIQNAEEIIKVKLLMVYLLNDR